MIDSYADIEYDEKTRRINRRMKFAFGGLGALTFIGLVIAIANTDLSTSKKAGISNDTEGTVSCVAVYRVDREERQLRETGRFAAHDEGDVIYGSSCSVFDRDGNYVSCLRVRHRSGVSDEQFLASAGDRRVKADACVYPR